MVLLERTDPGVPIPAELRLVTDARGNARLARLEAGEIQVGLHLRGDAMETVALGPSGTTKVLL